MIYESNAANPVQLLFCRQRCSYIEIRSSTFSACPYGSIGVDRASKERVKRPASSRYFRRLITRAQVSSGSAQLSGDASSALKRSFLINA